MQCMNSFGSTPPEPFSHSLSIQHRTPTDWWRSICTSMSRMETYPTTVALGDESAQMFSLNKRLEAYLSRVKALEEENELLRAEIQHLQSTRANKSTVRKYHDEIMKLRDALDDGHREMVQVEIDRDSIYQELEYVTELCHHEKQAQEDAKKELSKSKKLLEEETRAQTWLKERLIQLEQEMEDILKTHEEDKALIEQEISSYSQRLENFKMVPANFKPVNVEDYANRLAQIWQGAVEEYKDQASALEAKLAQAKENLKKVLDENKQGQQELQNLEGDLQSLKVRKEMLENLLTDQWMEQQEEEGRLQLEIEALEKEKQDLRVQIAQVLEDRQQLMHLKMSLSLEVATYRSLLEAESTRLYSPSADYKISSSFNDSVLEQSSFRKGRHENIKALVPSDNRLKANKKQSAETSSTKRYLHVKSTSFSNRSSPVTKEFQKVSSVLQSQGLNYTKASSAKASTPLPPAESILGRHHQNGDVVKKKKVHFISYSQDSSKPVTKEITRKENDIESVLNGNVYHTIDTELKKTDRLNGANGEKETESVQVESTLETEEKHIQVISDFGLEEQHFVGALKKDIDTLVFEKPHKENTDLEVLLANDDHTSDGNINGENIIEKQEVIQTVSSQIVYAEGEELVEPLEYHNMESSIKVHDEEFRTVLDYIKPNTQDIDKPNVFGSDGGPEQGTEYSLSQELDFDTPVSYNADVDNASHGKEEDTNQEVDGQKESREVNESLKVNRTEETPKDVEAEVNLQNKVIIIDQKIQVLSSLKVDNDQLFDHGHNLTKDIYDEQESQMEEYHENTEKDTEEVPQNTNIEKYIDNELDHQPSGQDEDILDGPLSLESEVDQGRDDKLEHIQFDQKKQERFQFCDAAESKGHLINEEDFETQSKKEEEEGFEKDYGSEENINNAEQNINDIMDREQSRIHVVKEVYQSTNQIQEDFEETPLQYQEENNFELSDVEQINQSYEVQHRSVTVKTSEETPQEYSDTNWEESDDQKINDILDQLDNVQEEVSRVSEEILDSPLSDLKSVEQSDAEQEGHDIFGDYSENKQVVQTTDSEGHGLLENLPDLKQEEIHELVQKENMISNDNEKSAEPQIVLSTQSEQYVGFSLNIIPNNLRFTSENDGEVEQQEKKINVTDEEAETHKDEIILEEKERELDIFEKEIICQQSTIVLEHERENLLLEDRKSHVLLAENPYDFDGPIEKSITALDDIEAANIPDNENLISEDSMDSQDISIYSQKSDEFEISKDYQLEQTLPDTTPLPNLDEFEDLVDEEIITEESVEVNKSQCPARDAEAEEVLDSSLESQSSQILTEVSDQSNVTKDSDYSEQQDQSPIDVIQREHQEHFVDYKLDSSAEHFTEEPSSELGEDPVESKTEDENAKSEHFVDAKLNTGDNEQPATESSEDPSERKTDDENTESAYFVDPKQEKEVVTKSKSLLDGGEGEEMLDSSSESHSLLPEVGEQVNLIQYDGKDFDYEQKDESPIELVESEHPEDFMDPKLHKEDSSTTLFTEEVIEPQSPTDSGEAEDFEYSKLDTKETSTTADTEEVTTSQSPAEGGEAEEVLDSSLESQSSQILLEEGHFADSKVDTEDYSAALVTEEPDSEDLSTALVTEEQVSETFEHPVESKIDDEKTKSEDVVDPKLDTEESSTTEDNEEVTKSQRLAEDGEAEEVLDSSLESQSTEILLKESETPTVCVESEQLEHGEDPKVDTENSSAALVTEEPASETFQNLVESKIVDEKTQSEDLVDPKLDTEESSTTEDTEEATRSQSLAEVGEAEEVLDSSLGGETRTDQVESEHLEHVVDPKVHTEDFSAALVTEEPVSETFERPIESNIDDEKIQSKDLVDPKLDTEESFETEDNEEVTKSQSLAEDGEAEEVLNSSVESQSSQILLEGEISTDQGANEQQEPFVDSKVDPEASSTAVLTKEPASEEPTTDQVEKEYPEHVVDSKVDTEGSLAALVTKGPDSKNSSAALVTEEPVSEDSTGSLVTEEPVSETFEDLEESKKDDEKTPSEDLVDPKLDTEESSTTADTEEATTSQNLAEGGEEVLDSSLESHPSEILLQEGETPADQVESEHLEHVVDPKVDTEDFSAALVTEEPVSETSERPVESNIDDEKTQSKDLVDPKLDTEESSETADNEEVTKSQSLAEDGEAEEVLDSSVESQSSEILLEGESPTDRGENEQRKNFVDSKVDPEASSTAVLTKEPASEEPTTDQVEKEYPEHVVDSKVDTEDYLDSENSSAALVTEEPVSEDSTGYVVAEEPVSETFEGLVECKIVHEKTQSEDIVNPKLDTEESSTTADTEEVTKSQSLAEVGEAEVLDSSIESQSSEIFLEEGETPADQVKSEHQEHVVDSKVDTEAFSATLVTEEPTTDQVEREYPEHVVDSKVDTEDSCAALVTEEPVSETFEGLVESKIDDEKTKSEDFVDAKLDTEESSTTEGTEEAAKSQSLAEGGEAEEVLDSSVESQSSQILLGEGETPADQVESEQQDYFEEPKVDKEDSSKDQVESEQLEHVVDPKVYTEDSSAALVTEEPVSETFENIVESKIVHEKTQSEDLVDPKLDTEESSTTADTEEATKSRCIAKGGEAEKEIDNSLESQSSQILFEEGETPTDQVENEQREHFVDPKLDTEDSSTAVLIEEPVSEKPSTDRVESEYPEHVVDSNVDTEGSLAALVTKGPDSKNSSAALVTEEPASETFEGHVESKIVDEKTQSEDLVDPKLDTEESSTTADTEEITKSHSLAEGGEAEEVLDSSLESKSSQILFEEGETPADQVKSEQLEHVVDPKVDTEDSSTALVTKESVSETFADIVQTKIVHEKTKSEDLVDPELDKEESYTTADIDKVTKSQSPVEDGEAEEVLDSSLESQSSQILLEEGETPADQVESEQLEHVVDPKVDTEDCSTALVTKESVSETFEDQAERQIDHEKTQSEDLVDPKLDIEESSTTADTEEVTKSQSLAEGGEAEKEIDNSLESQSSQILLEEDETPTDRVESEHLEHVVDSEASCAALVTEEPVSEDSTGSLVTEEPVSEDSTGSLVTEEPVSEDSTGSLVTEEPVSEDSTGSLVTEEPVSEDSTGSLVTEEPVSETFEDHGKSKNDDEKTKSEDFVDPKLETEESSTTADTEEVTKTQSPAEGGEAEEVLDSSIESQSSQILLEEAETDRTESEHLEHFEEPKVDTEDSSTALVAEETAFETFADLVESKIDDAKTPSEDIVDPKLDTEESSTTEDTEEVTKSQSPAEGGEEVLDSSVESQLSEKLLKEGETPTDRVESERQEHFVDPKVDTEDSSAALVTEGPVSEDSIGSLVTEEPASETFKCLVESKIVDEKTQSEDLVDPKLDTEESSTTADTEEATRSQSLVEGGEAEEVLDSSIESQSSQILLEEGEIPTGRVESEHLENFVDSNMDTEDSATTLDTEDVTESQSPKDKGEAKEVLISSLESQSSQILSEVSQQSNLLKDSEYYKQHDESPIHQVGSQHPEKFLDSKMDAEDPSTTLVTEEPLPKTFKEPSEINANVANPESEQSATNQEEIENFSSNVELEASIECQVEKTEFDTSPPEDQEHLTSKQLGKESVNDDHNGKHEGTDTENLLSEPTELVPSPSHEHITENEEYITMKHSDLVTQDFSLEQRENVDTEDHERDFYKEKDKECDGKSTEGAKEPSTEHLDEFNEDNVISSNVPNNEECEIQGGITLGTDQDDVQVGETPSEESSENDGSIVYGESSPNVSTFSPALEQENSKTQLSEKDDIGVDTESKSPREHGQNDPLLTSEPESSLAEQTEPQASSDDEKAIASDSSYDSSREHDDMSEYTREYSEDGKRVNGINGHTIVQATLDLEAHLYNGHSTEQDSKIIISEAKIIRSDGDIVKSQSQDKIEDSLIEFTVSEGKSEGFFQSLIETSEGCLDEASEIKNNIQTAVTYVDSDNKKVINPYLRERDLGDPSEITSEDLVDTNREVSDTNQGLKINQKQEGSWSSDE
ncbi:nestin isoform X2 [Hyla sarda]|uniref:nestin isoform X2 n=1 Tax=Hyla sarda TaxID=327740 RepID=UPI0024C2B367|nr:nestin isoform X2 [Hyla sarda]